MTLETGASLPIDIHCAKKSILHQKMKDEFALHISNKEERQTACRSSLIWVHFVPKYLDTRRKQTRFIVTGAFMVELFC